MHSDEVTSVSQVDKESPTESRQRQEAGDEVRAVDKSVVKGKGRGQGGRQLQKELVHVSRFLLNNGQRTAFADLRFLMLHQRADRAS